MSTRFIIGTVNGRYVYPGEGPIMDILAIYRILGIPSDSVHYNIIDKVAYNIFLYNLFKFEACWVP